MADGLKLAHVALFDELLIVDETALTQSWVDQENDQVESLQRSDDDDEDSINSEDDDYSASTHRGTMHGPRQDDADDRGAAQCNED